MPKIKVLHIIKSLGRGGAEMLLPETLKLHDHNKFDFHYIYFLPWKDQMVEYIQKIGGKVSCISAKNNIELIGKYPEVIEYCKNEKIDLIHCHLPWAGFLGRLIYRKTGIPVLYSEHNMQERYHFITKAINKFSFNSQSLAIGVSEDVSNSIKSNINPKIPVKTILNGVNTESFIRSENDSIRKQFDIPRDALVFGNVAVFRFQKRLVQWLRIFKNIKESNSHKVYGIIVGAGPLESEIQAEVEKLNLGNSVYFPGLQTNVKPYLEAMDVFMMSSSFEGLPIALLEAMSMECAIVSTNAGGIKEVIRNGKDGLLCDVDQWKDLEHLSNKLINDPELLKNLSINARERVKKEFSMVKMVEELERNYETFSV
ncbi:glycosyltransferase [Gramella sp. MT6]|uniref:glycosyltransferase n=1 Tax=Gramella sp. MT6 TaxID=2705471 RepID=UPI001C5D8DB8|nr:glycosyltransferase [Gramella sp. MT6]QYA26043.1 glycosyltransferase [Gramella sp. MT6]